MGRSSEQDLMGARATKLPPEYRAAENAGYPSTHAQLMGKMFGLLPSIFLGASVAREYRDRPEEFTIPGVLRLRREPDIRFET